MGVRCAELYGGKVTEINYFSIFKTDVARFLLVVFMCSGPHQVPRVDLLRRCVCSVFSRVAVLGTTKHQLCLLIRIYNALSS